MSQISIILQLLRRDLLQFKREFLGKLLDTASLLFTMLVVFGYFMSSYGLGSSYGPFMLVSAIASFGFFDIIGKISSLIADIEGDKTIAYKLTLPLTSSSVFIYIAISWALNSALISIFLFPIGKLILFNQFDLSHISFGHFFLMYITMNFFYGFFSLWLTSMLKNIGDLGVLWIRVINPLLMFGAYFYSWEVLYKLSPIIAYIDLINPLVYVMEGMRSAALGKGFLSFWICFPVLWIFIIACALHGIYRLKKRLDCV